MLTSTLLTGGSINIRLSPSAYDILSVDCFKFGFIKNGKANISYIISKLIKELTRYRDNLHDELLKSNNNNLDIVKTIEFNIFNTYQKAINYICDDSYVNIGYRANKEFMPYINHLFCETLEKYNMEFTSYVRSILYEYCSRNDLQRELFLNYTLVGQIKNAIKKELVVDIVNDGIKDEIILVSIESTEFGFNYILGITRDKAECRFLPLSKTTFFNQKREKIHIEQEYYDKIITSFNKFVEEIKDNVRIN